MGNTNIKAVILDLDQTLTTDETSWIQFTELLGADPAVHMDIFNRFKTGKLGYVEAKQELIALWRTVHKLDLAGIKEIFTKIELREGVQEGVAYLKSKYELCIISGAIDVFVNIIADELGIIDRYAFTKFIFNAEDFLTDFQYTLSRGGEKVSCFKDFCSKNNLKPKECVAIGDGDSDAPLFKEVAYPILFVASDTSYELKKKVKVHLNNWSEISQIL